MLKTFSSRNNGGPAIGREPRSARGDAEAGVA